MSSMGSMPEVKVAKDDSDAIVGWVGLLGSVRFGRGCPFSVMPAFLLYHNDANPLYISFDASGPPSLSACGPRRTKTRNMNIRHKHRIRLFRTMSSILNSIRT